LAILASKARPIAFRHPLEFSVSIGRFLDFMQLMDFTPELEGFAQALRLSGPDDRVRIYAEAIPNGINYRVAAESAIFKAIRLYNGQGK
jgi:hypothetical protein